MMRHRFVWSGVISLALAISLPTEAYAAAPIISGNAGVAPVSSNTLPVTSSVDSNSMVPLTLDQRVARLENQVTYLNQMNQAIAQLQQRMNTLEGKLEDLQHQVNFIQKSQAALGVLAERVMQLETQSRLSHVGALPKTQATPANPSETQAYDAAYQWMVKKQYTTAIKAFESFTKQYPNGAETGLAYYWLGELYLAEGQPDLATQKFRTAANMKGNAKAPDALLKMGIIFLANGDSAHAKQSFQRVVSDYSGTPQAQEAAQRLKDMSANP